MASLRPPRRCAEALVVTFSNAITRNKLAQDIRWGVLIVRIAGAAIVAAAMSIAGAAGAGSAYDGSWSLSITTERGNCDREYRLPVPCVRPTATIAAPIKALRIPCQSALAPRQATRRSKRVSREADAGCDDRWPLR